MHALTLVLPFLLQTLQRASRSCLLDGTRIRWTSLAGASQPFAVVVSRRPQTWCATRKTDEEINSMVDLEVCLSPGCQADGAKETLDKLVALAPPTVRVCEGGCISGCGNGPIVVETSQKAATSSTKTVRHRKLQGQKLSDYICPPADDEEFSIIPKTPKSLLLGYELMVEADQSRRDKDLEAAVSLYQRAFSQSFADAMTLQRARERLRPDTFSSNSLVGIEWLVHIRAREAECELELGHMEGALLAAQSACNLSKNTSVDAFLVLADVYKSTGDIYSEIQALKTIFAVSPSDDQLTNQERNLRRELRFRLERLESEAKNTS